MSNFKHSIPDGFEDLVNLSILATSVANKAICMQVLYESFLKPSAVTCEKNLWYYIISFVILTMFLIMDIEIFRINRQATCTELSLKNNDVVSQNLSDSNNTFGFIVDALTARFNSIFYITLYTLLMVSIWRDLLV